MKELILAEDSKSASQFNGRPEEGGIDDSGDSIKGTDRDDLIFATTGNKRIFGKKGKDTLRGSRDKDTIYGGKDDDDCDGDDGDDEIRGDRGKDTCKGGNGNDSLFGGKDNDTLIGGNGNDTSTGDDDDDIVYGNEGNDDSDGGNGNDSVYGGKGDDTCKGGAGKDQVNGGLGNDKCDGGDDDDQVNGGKGKDTVIGANGNDTLMGDDDDDSVVGGEGKDTVIGGAGKDTCMGDDGDDSISGGGDDDTLMGGAGNDICMGDDGDDSVAGGGGDDTVMGGGGKDTLVAGDGKDMVDGGDGDDSVVGGGNGDDTLMGSGGNDTIVGGTGNHTCVGGAGDDVFAIADRNSGPNSVITDFTVNDKFLISGNLNFSSFSFVQVGINTEIRGSSNFVLALLLNVNASILKAGNFLGIDVPANFNQVTTPTPVKVPPIVLPPTPVTTPTPVTNTIDKTASTQPELITGNSSLPNDLKGGSGDDTITGGKNKDTIIGNKGKDKIKGDDGDDDIDGGDDDDDIEGGVGIDKIKGGIGKDKIKGDDGDDDIDGGDDDDDIEGGIGKDKIKGGIGKDKVKGDDGDDDIDGGDDDDDIEGGLGNDKVIGSAGNDKLTGNEGDDDIDGGEGTNTLKGGSGRDKFIYKTSRENIPTVELADLIEDFNVDDDLLDFSNAAFGISAANLTRVEINATSANGSIGSGNLLDFSADVNVKSIATLQARFEALGGDRERPTFCQFTDEATGRTVLVFAVGIRFDIVASFSAKFSLKVSNFVFTGPPLNLPVGTSGPDNVNFGTAPVGIKFDGLAGNDKIIGSNFGDTINGGDGDDTITGGGGVDILNGGSGADIFAYTTTKEGGDKISDFKSGTDKFQFVTSAFGNLTTTNFDGVSGSAPDITGKELVIFTGGTYASVEAAQAKATGSSSSPAFFVYTNAANETVLAFDSNGTAPGGFTKVASLGTAAGNLGTADFVFTGAFGSSPAGTSPAGTTPSANSSIVNLIANPGTFPTSGIINFGSGVGGYNFSTPVLFTGNGSANTVIGTPFADRIEGGGGADILTGGSGADLFIYKNPGEGDDKITDFTSGVDKLQFTANTFGNFTTTNFDSVSGSAPDITGKELVIFTGGTYANVEAAQAKATGSSTTPGFFAFKNAANETVLVFDSNGTTTGGSTTVANFGTAAVSLGTSDFVFTGALGSSPAGTSPAGTSPAGTTPSANSTVNLVTNQGTYPIAINNFGSGVGGYNFSTPILFTGDSNDNNVTATQFADFMTGGGGNDIFDGGLGDDNMTGDDGNDSLFGGGGNDTISGGNGNDTLIGGLGTNALSGGDGVDVFVFSSGTTAGGGDLITSYNIADDVINLDKTGFAALTTGAGLLGSSFYKYSSTVSVSVTTVELSLTGPSIMAIYDGLSTKLYYDSNGSTPGGSNLFATVDVNLGVSGNSELFLF